MTYPVGATYKTLIGRTARSLDKKTTDRYHN